MIEVDGLCKSYGGQPALTDVSFSVPRGQVLGFLGPNGAGKSTTMRILTGYLGADQGRASIAGYDVETQSREVRRRVGYLPELAPLYGEMRVESFLEVVCRLRAVPTARRRGRIDHAIEVCGLSERRHQIIGRLSKGLRQRVGLAQAVVHDPEVLILDEPTAGLDPAQTRETRDLIAELGHTHTIILSSHILSEVSATCQRVVIINRGRIVADDTPANLSQGLAGRRHQELEILVQGSLTQLRAALDGVLGGGGYRIESTSPDEHRVLAEVEGAETQDRLTQAILGAHLRLRGLSLGAPTLEDVYLELTHEERS
ncbi:MAG: ABC transporter ATP-binding protein [Candidatus Dormibacteraceae bacterium]